MKNHCILRKSYVIVLILYTVVGLLGNIVNGSPISDETNISSNDIKRSNDDLPEDSMYLIKPDFAGEARIFGNFSFGNSSILTVAGFVIVGIILFELALYALDVYNQQQIASYSYTSKNDNEWIGNRYSAPTYDPTSSNKRISPVYPPYYDSYHGIYRHFSTEWKDLDKIVMWIQAAYEMYSAGKTVINDLECQMKVICEIYRDDTNELGEIGKRAKHSLDFVDTVEYLNLPDAFINLADEYVMAKESAKDPIKNCEELYPYCPYSLTKIKKKYDNLVK